jgi:DNA-binding NtrC family response regulator
MNDQATQSVLVVDDEPGMRMALQANFQREGWRVETASGASDALRRMQNGHFPLVVTDVRMPDGNGLQLMRSVRSAHPSTAVIVLTAFGNVPEAVKAIQDGACDYLTKPISFEQLQSSVSRVMQHVKNSVVPTAATRNAIVGTAPALLQALDRARHAARTNADVLIEAESGTGKELLARKALCSHQLRGCSRTSTRKRALRSCARCLYWRHCIESRKVRTGRKRNSAAG